MSCIIISGGTIALEELQKSLDNGNREDLCLIAADRGMETVERLHLLPDYIIGDFDSADAEAYRYARTLSETKRIPLTKLNPVKDDTDSEAALHLAFLHSEGDIRIFGGTGTRIDHVLSNIMMMKQGEKQGRRIFLIDGHNRIRLCFPGRPVRIKKTEQFGKYVSVIPVSGPASGVTMDGFYYPLHDADLSGADSLGNSNEITAEEGTISVNRGVLCVVESRD